MYSFILTEFTRVLDATCAKLISLSLIRATDGLAFKYSGLSIESLLFRRNVCARGELRLGDDFRRGGDELRIFGYFLGVFFFIPNIFLISGVGDEPTDESLLSIILNMGDPCGS